MVNIEENLKNLKERIRSSALKVNRSPEEIKLVAVTKSFDTEVVKKAYELGLIAIGETKVQEAERKQRELRSIEDKIEWRMIGHLQSNKAKQAVKIFDSIDSIDRMKIAKKVNSECLKYEKKMPVLVQVDLSGKTYGVKPEKTADFVNKIREFNGIQVEGLMTIAPLVDDPEKTRPYFRELKNLAEACNLKHLSMGMSNDFEVAIEEGSTMVRIGTAIFGDRE